MESHHFSRTAAGNPAVVEAVVAAAVVAVDDVVEGTKERLQNHCL